MTSAHGGLRQMSGVSLQICPLGHPPLSYLQDRSQNGSPVTSLTLHLDPCIHSNRSHGL